MENKKRLEDMSITEIDYFLTKMVIVNGYKHAVGDKYQKYRDRLAELRTKARN
jgi:hypothetical protein